jgi:hypothetical protein
MVTIGDDLLRPASPEFGPAIEALVVYNSNPVAVAPDSGKVVQGFAREDLFTVVLEHFQTDTADYADYILPATTQLEHWDVHLSYGHTDVLLNRPAIAPVGEAKPNTQIFRELGGPHGFCRRRFFDPCFAETTKACAAPPMVLRWISNCCCARVLPRCPADAPFAQGGFPHAIGSMRVFQRALQAQGLDGLPDHHAQLRGRRPVHGLPAGHDFAPGAQLFELELCQREEPAR